MLNHANNEITTTLGQHYRLTMNKKKGHRHHRPNKHHHPKPSSSSWPDPPPPSAQHNQDQDHDEDDQDEDNNSGAGEDDFDESEVVDTAALPPLAMYVSILPPAHLCFLHVLPRFCCFGGG